MNEKENVVCMEVRVYKDRKYLRSYYPVRFFERIDHNGYYEYHFYVGEMLIVYSSAFGYRCRVF